MVVPSFGVSRTFETTLERLWAAFTDFRELSEWALPPGSRLLLADMDLSPGGAFQFGFTLPEGKSLWGGWAFDRIEPPSRLTLVHDMAGGDGPTANAVFPGWPARLRVDLRIAVQGEGTTVTVNLAPLDALGSEAHAFRASFAALSAGWERALNRLDRHLTRP